MDNLAPIIALLFVIAAIAGLWKAFAKAGAPGWSCLVPILNIYVLVKMSGRPVWWIILFFIPIISIVPAILIPIDIAKNFGKGIGTALGLIFLGFIFWPILGFGSAEWQAEEFSW